MPANKKNVMTILCFNVADVHLGIYLKYIERIVFLPMVTAIPDSPDYIVGIMNYCGRSMYLYDLAMLLGIRRSNLYTVDTNVLICNVNDTYFGLVIDKIERQISILESQVECKDEFYDERGLINSVVIINDKQRLLLDANSIMRITHKITKDESDLVSQKQGTNNG